MVIFKGAIFYTVSHLCLFLIPNIDVAALRSTIGPKKKKQYFALYLLLPMGRAAPRMAAAPIGV